MFFAYLCFVCYLIILPYTASISADYYVIAILLVFCFANFISAL